MWSRKAIAIAVGAFFAVGILSAGSKKNWWDEPYAKWSQSKTVELFNKSPWVQHWGYTTQTTGEHGSGPGSVAQGADTQTSPDQGATPGGGVVGAMRNQGQAGSPAGVSTGDLSTPAGPGVSGGQGTLGVDVKKDMYIVRVFSAQPMREAYVRLLQLMNNYDSLPAARKKEFDAKVGGLATTSPGDDVVVSVAFQSNDPQRELDLKRWFGTVTTHTLSQSAYLYTSSAGQITLKKYMPPEGGGGIGARFIFPRTINGKPIAQEGDKEFRFQVYIPLAGRNLYVDFKPKDMIYQGSLNF
jgi:hypothetical protein